MSRRAWMAVALLGLMAMIGAAIVLGGCGGDDETTTTAAAETTTSTEAAESTTSTEAAAPTAFKVGFVNSATGVSAAPNQSIVGATMGAVGEIPHPPDP